MNQQNVLRRRLDTGGTPVLMVVAQIVAGAAAGASIAYLGMLIGGRFFAGDVSGFGDIVAQLGGLVIGFPFGAAVGVWLAGRLLGGRAAFWATLLGSALGIASVLFGAALFVYHVALGWSLLFICGLAGALAGYHLSWRRRRRGEGDRQHGEAGERIREG